MYIFDDLKSPFEELKNYFSLYNIVLPDHRIQYYVEVIEDMVHNKEPVIRYLEDLIAIVKKKEPSFNKGTYKAWRKNNKELPEDEAFKQFSIYMEKSKQIALNKKAESEKRKEEFQKKRDDKIKAQYLLNIYKLESPQTQALTISLDNFEIKEHKTISDAAIYSGLSTVANAYVYSRKGNAIGNKYIIRLTNDKS